LSRVITNRETFGRRTGYTGLPMMWLRGIFFGAALAAAGLGATFGTVIPTVGGLLDIVLDEGRNRLYLVNPSYNRVEVYAIAQRRFLSPVAVDRLPISAALSRSGKFLYVTCFDGTSLNVIDLDTMTVSRRVSLPAKPEGVAVGADERVLITTIGTGPNNQAYTLLIYDPAASEGQAIGNVVIAPPPPQSPRLPPPVGRLALAARSRLVSTPDGRYIIGLSNINNNTGVAFLYESASASVLRSRQIGNISTVLSVAPDGSKFMAGLTLFETETLTVLAQQNAANAPFPFQPGAQFSLTDNVGGSVFAPDGGYLYSAFNIPPVSSPPARPNVSQLLINDPDNLLIHLALQLAENVAGKMVISSDGGVIYAISESGFMILPVGRLLENPIAMPESRAVLLANDQCGVAANQRSAVVRIQNLGRGRLSITPQLLQIPQTPQAGIPGLGGSGPGGGAPGGTIVIVLPPAPGTQPAPVTGAAPGAQVPAGPGQQQPAVAQTAPLVRTRLAEQAVEFIFNANAARALGTITPHDFTIQVPEAINIPPRIRVYQNNRDAEARGDIVPIEVGISNQEGLVDLALDAQRQRLYLANSGLNRVEVFDLRSRRLLEPIKVGQLPRSLALTPDGNTLYVANSGGESISIVDPNLGREVGRVRFPALPFNASAPLVTPSVIAAGLSGLQIVMSNGTLWQVIGNEAVPRPLSPAIGSLTVPAPRSMVATPGGEYILLVAGANNTMAYLYDGTVDEYVLARQVVTGAAQGFLGPVAAGPRGQYYVIHGMLFTQSLTRLADAPSVQIPARPGQTATMNRPVAAVTPVSANTYARFIQPVLAAATALPGELPVVEVVDATTGAVLRSAPALEAPLSTVVGAGRAFINGRTMALDPSGQAAYVLTASGLSIVPLDQPARLDRPTVNRNGVVNMASYTTSVAPGGLISIFGQALAASGTATSTPLPYILGGACVTVANRALPLLMTSPTQINAQLPFDLAAGRYTLVVRAVDRKVASTSYSLTVSKYAPAVFVDPITDQAAIYHPDGRPVTKENPARRDRTVSIYATGLGPTHGGRAVAGMPAPSEPLAVTDPVKVFFGDPRYQQSEMIVEWSGLQPGAIGVYRIDVRVPGFRSRGDALPVTVRIGGVDSPSSAPVVPKVAVD